MKKIIFIPNRWVKLLFNGEVCIGTTYLYDEKYRDEPLYQLVFLMSQKRKTKIVNFCECVEIKYLEFVQKSLLKNYFSNNEIFSLQKSIDILINPNMDKNALIKLAEKQTNKLSRN